MKTLYVSDLDGTLLNSKKKITDYSAEVINRCVEKGMLFSVATARMPYGCDYRLEALDMRTPGILTNGVFIYDFNKKEYVHTEIIEESAAVRVAEAFRVNGMECFMYVFRENQIELYYGAEELKEQTQYYSDRALAECGRVALTEDYREQIRDSYGAADSTAAGGAGRGTGGVCYFALTGAKEELEPVKTAVDSIGGVSAAFYLNIYNGLYCLEVFSSRASKKTALLRLKDLLGCDELVVFGDNYNDVPMIEIADRSYAPANALDEIKAMVTEVLEDCDHDGVAKFLEKEMEKN